MWEWLSFEWQATFSSFCDASRKVEDSWSQEKTKACLRSIDQVDGFWEEEEESRLSMMIEEDLDKKKTIELMEDKER